MVCISALLQFAKYHMDKPQDHWKRYDTKIVLFDLNEKHYVWRKGNTASQHKNLL